MGRHRKLLVGGFMGVGKSTVGRRAAEMAGVPFIDLDAAIEARAGRPIAAIFAELGESAFRALEADELAQVLASEERAVVALGGGALVEPSRRRAALERACIVTLTAHPATLAGRTAERPARCSPPPPTAPSASASSSKPAPPSTPRPTPRWPPTTARSTPSRRPSSTPGRSRRWRSRSGRGATPFTSPRARRQSWPTSRRSSSRRRSSW